MARLAYPNDDEWALVIPYLILMTKDASQRDHSVCEVFHGLCWIVRVDAAGRMLLHDLPPWHTVYQQSQGWLKAGVFAAIVRDLHAVLWLTQGLLRSPRPRSSPAVRCNRPPQVVRGWL